METLKKDFINNLLSDEEINEKIPVIRPYLKQEKYQLEIYSLCRATFLTQFNAEIFKDGSVFKSYISNEQFAELGIKISQFINTLDEENKEVVFEEVIIILKEYYNETSTTAEVSQRTHLERTNIEGKSFGHYGTLYNFNEIHWNSFLKGIKENINL